MKINLYTCLFILAGSLMATQLASCGNTKSEGSENIATADSSEHQGDHTELIELTAKQINAVGIQTGPVEQKNLNAVIKSSGQLAVPPQNKAEVNVLMGGIIRKINVLEGQAVKRGQVLVLLENTDFVKLQEEYLTLTNSFSFTENELTRQKELNEAKAGTGKNLQQAQANYNAQRARISTMERQLQQLGINPTRVAQGNIISQVAVTAPISGTVGHIAVNTGTYAETSKPLMEIIDNSQIHCDLVVYEKDLFKVKIGQKVNFTLTNQNNQQIQGEIYGVNKSFEDDSKGIIVHAVIKNAGRHNLIPGMYVTALIDIGNQLTPAVPADAVVRSEGKDYIYLVAEEGAERHSEEKEAKPDSTHEEHIAFKKVEVVTGVAELGYVQINALEELPENVKIVTKGAFYLLSKEKATGHDDH